MEKGHFYTMWRAGQEKVKQWIGKPVWKLL